MLAALSLPWVGALIALVGTLAAVAAAGFAGLQIQYSRRDANRRAVLDHLRDVDARLQAVWGIDPKSAQDEVLAYYGHQTSGLSDEARRYLALLDSLDLLALSDGMGLVDRRAVREHVRTLLGGSTVPDEFLGRLQDCCGDSSVYEHLRRYLANIHEDSARNARTKESRPAKAGTQITPGATTSLPTGPARQG